MVQTVRKGARAVVPVPLKMLARLDKPTSPAIAIFAKEKGGGIRLCMGYACMRLTNDMVLVATTKRRMLGMGKDDIQAFGANEQELVMRCDPILDPAPDMDLAFLALKHAGAQRVFALNPDDPQEPDSKGVIHTVQNVGYPGVNSLSRSKVVSFSRVDELKLVAHAGASLGSVEVKAPGAEIGDRVRYRVFGFQSPDDAEGSPLLGSWDEVYGMVLGTEYLDAESLGKPGSVTYCLPRSAITDAWERIIPALKERIPELVWEKQ